MDWLAFGILALFLVAWTVYVARTLKLRNGHMSASLRRIDTALKNQQATAEHLGDTLNQWTTVLQGILSTEGANGTPTQRGSGDPRPASSAGDSSVEDRPHNVASPPVVTRYYQIADQPRNAPTPYSSLAAVRPFLEPLAEAFHRHLATYRSEELAHWALLRSIASEDPEHHSALPYFIVGRCFLRETAEALDQEVRLWDLSSAMRETYLLRLHVSPGTFHRLTDPSEFGSIRYIILLDSLQRGPAPEVAPAWLIREMASIALLNQSRLHHHEPHEDQPEPAQLLQQALEIQYHKRSRLPRRHGRLFKDVYAASALLVSPEIP